MRLIGLAIVLTLSLAFVPLAGEAQQAGKVYRIGYLTVPSRESQDTFKAFERGLHDLGWIEGGT